MRRPGSRNRHYGLTRRSWRYGGRPRVCGPPHGPVGPPATFHAGAGLPVMSAGRTIPGAAEWRHGTMLEKNQPPSTRSVPSPAGARAMIRQWGAGLAAGPGRPAVPDGPAAPREGTGRQGDRRGPGAAGCRSGGTGNGGRPSAPEADPKGAGRQPAGRKDCNSSSGRAALFAGKRMECGRRSEGTREGAVAREAGRSGKRREKRAAPAEPPPHTSLAGAGRRSSR